MYGSAKEVNALKAEFTNLGLHGQLRYPLSFSNLRRVYSNGPLTWAFMVMAVAVVTMIGASVLLSAKAYGVLRLQGKSYVEILSRDLRRLGMFWAIIAGVVAAATLICLWFYNHLAWLVMYTSLAASIAGALTVLAVTAHAAILGMLFNTGVLRALKGDLPVRAASFCAYLVRIPALLVAVGIAAAVVSSGQDVLARQANQDAYRKAGDAVYILINGSLGKEEPQMEKRVSQWLRQADTNGEIVLAGRRELQSLAPPGSALPQGDVLIVNDTFLAKQPVLDTSGRRLSPRTSTAPATNGGPVQLIIPQSLARYAPTINTGISANLNAGHPEIVQQAGIQTRWARNGQRVFGYSTGSASYTADPEPDRDRSLVTDPVIVVVPNGSKVIPNGDYIAYASQKEVVFANPQDALDGVAANNLQTYITAVSPVALNAALEQRNVLREFRLQTFNLVVAAAVLVITGLGVCIVYSRKNAQAIFARHISGWTFAASHRSILSAEATLGALLIVWVPLHAWWQNRDLDRYAALGIPAPRSRVPVTAEDISLAIVLTVIEIGAVLIALAAISRRTIRERATEA